MSFELWVYAHCRQFGDSLLYQPIRTSVTFPLGISTIYSCFHKVACPAF